MKKTMKATALFLAAGLLLTACGGKTDTAATTAAAESAKADAETTAAAAETDAKKPSFVFVCTGQLGDKSFNDSANAGMEKIASDLGCEIKVIEIGRDQTKWEPTFQDLAEEGKYDVITKESIPERMPYERMESYLKEVFAEYPDDYYGETISKSTPFNIAKAAFNFEEALFDIRHKLPKKDFGIFELIEDYGIRILSYGNAGGGYFGGPYRSFLIEYKGNIEFISFAFSTYARTEKTGIVKTCLNIAHDDEKETHHALQLSFDDNIQVIGDKVTIYHSGRIAIGNKGSGKIDELRQFVAERYPKIIDGKRFNLGSLKNDYQWNIDQPDVTEVIVNLISYALIRDEYRDYIKQQ